MINIWTEEEKTQAKRNLKVADDYFNSQSSNTYKLNFAEGKDRECQIYDQNKYSSPADIKQKLEDIFN